MSIKGLFQRNLISLDWALLEKQQKINVMLIVSLQCVVLFVNIGSIDKLFNAFYGKTYLETYSLDLVYMFVSTTILMLIVFVIYLRISQWKMVVKNVNC